MLRFLLALALVLTPSSCHLTQTDPETGEVSLSPSAAARDARAFSIVALEVAETFRASDPALAAKVEQFGVALNRLSVTWETIALGQGSGGLADQVQAAIDVGSSILDELAPEEMEKWRPYIASVRIMLRMANLYATPPPP